MKAINTHELKNLQQSADGDILLINTLDQEYFEKEHIPRSKNVPQNRDDFVEKVNQLAGSKDRTVVVYCANADCPSSTKGGKKLEAAGFTHVFDYEGGLRAWKEDGEHIDHGLETA